MCAANPNWTKPMPARPVVAVAGVTGAVGEEMLKCLSERNFPAAEVRALASSRSAGKKVAFDGPGSVDGFLTVQEMTPESFEGVDIALFSAGGTISEAFAQAVTAAGAVMVDNSSAFRMRDDVPLVVPEVNPQDVQWHSGIIANPNCSTIQMVVALNPLRALAPIKRVVVSTYQAVSGAGAQGTIELREQTGAVLSGQEYPAQKFAHQIAFNCIPQIDVFLEDGSTKEEWKMVAETKKIMNDPSIQVNATCVRVPVYRCHSESINVEFDGSVALADVRAALESAPGVVVMDDPAALQYPMPAMLESTNLTYIGRLRTDPTVPSGISMWCVADQLRKGAALNTVQIAELLLPEA